jgi:glycerol uptake facilitator-like aquaporin
MLLAVVVGSATMGDRLAGGNAAIALFTNTIATGAGLLALILTFGTISGAHFNPIVTLSEAWQGNVPRSEVLPYLVAQLIGAFAGVAAAHLMFGLPVFEVSQHLRPGPALWWSEFVASFGLIAVIMGCARSRPSLTPFAVAAYITAGYWFTASSAFANPALTLARMATNTVAGIRPGDASGFIVAELLGGAAATLLFSWLYPPAPYGATVGGTVTPGEFSNPDAASR